MTSEDLQALQKAREVLYKAMTGQADTSRVASSVDADWSYYEALTHLQDVIERHERGRNEA